MAVRASDGHLILSNTRKARFETGFWLRQEGQGLEPNNTRQFRWGKGWNEKGNSLKCDDSGCIYQVGKTRIALVKHVEALIEDCWVADMVISLEPIRRSCPAPLGTIDWFDLWRHGSHAIWIDKQKIRIENVNQSRGHRPWVVRPKPRPKRSLKN